MALPLYDVVVAPFLQVLGGVTGFLEKGRVHCQENGIDLNELVETRLYPDMLPLRFQLVSVAQHSKGALDGALAGVYKPPSATAALDYAALQDLVAQARAGLEAVSAETVNALEGKDVVFEIGERRLPFTAESFFLSFSMPNLHFHATTAYDILRMKGVPLGKRDYLGQLRLKR
jgi:hypothetical protein